MFAWAAAPMAMLGGAVSMWGPEGGALLAGQAALSVLMLEAANYVQHYGLERTKLDNGRYVFCTKTWLAAGLIMTLSVVRFPCKCC